MVSTSNDVYEPDLNAAFRQWFNERKKPTYFIGPIIPSDSVSTSRDFGIPSNVENVQTFLDKVLNNHGRRSMLYVRSFSMSMVRVDVYLGIIRYTVLAQGDDHLENTRSNCRNENSVCKWRLFLVAAKVIKFT